MLYIPKTSNCDWYEYRQCTFKDVVNAVINPTTEYLSKDDVPLWAFYTPKNPPDIGYYGKPKFNAVNMVNCYALLLDFDNDGTAFDNNKKTADYISVDDAIEKFSDFEFALYTSYRHKPEHHKFRLVVPLATPIINAWFSYDSVKSWFINKFTGVDVRASIKTLQKHKIPACHPSDTHYRYYINEAPRLELPLQQFNDDIYYEILAKPEPIKVRAYTGFLNLTIDDIETNIKQDIAYGNAQKTLESMNWDRGSGNDVHGNLLKIAYNLQCNKIFDWEDLMVSYAPDPVTIAEIKRMRIK